MIPVLSILCIWTSCVSTQNTLRNKGRVVSWGPYTSNKSQNDLRRTFVLRYDTSTFGKINQTIRHSRILDVRFLGEFLTIVTLFLKDTAVCQQARYLCKLWCEGMWSENVKRRRRENRRVWHWKLNIISTSENWDVNLAIIVGWEHSR